MEEFFSCSYKFNEWDASICISAAGRPVKLSEISDGNFIKDILEWTFEWIRIRDVSRWKDKIEIWVRFVNRLSRKEKMELLHKILWKIQVELIKIL